MKRVATRFTCTNRVTAHCVSGTGKPRRKTCSACSSPLLIETGAYGVFNWTGTGQYPLHSAIGALYVRPDAAERAATAAGEWYVVRWVPETEITARADYLARLDKVTAGA